LHQRYRFDPLGLNKSARERLKELCRAQSGSGSSPTKFD
jgi:hypothetical protein